MIFDTRIIVISQLATTVIGFPYKKANFRDLTRNIMACINNKSDNRKFLNKYVIENVKMLGSLEKGIVHSLEEWKKMKSLNPEVEIGEPKLYKFNINL